MKTKYKLLKDTPIDAVGSIFVKMGCSYYKEGHSPEVAGRGQVFEAHIVEDNPEWFEKQPEPIRIFELTNGTFNFKQPAMARYGFSASRHIPEANFSAIVKVIEAVVNDVPIIKEDQEPLWEEVAKEFGTISASRLVRGLVKRFGIYRK